MGKIDQALSTTLKFLSVHRMQIFKVGAYGGVALTAFTALKEGPEIKRIIDEKMRDLELTPKEDKETRWIIYAEGFKKIAPRVAKIIAAAAMTMSCIHGLDKTHAQNYAAAAALAATTQQKLDDFERITREKYGDKRLEDIKAAYAEEKAKEKPKIEDNDPYDGRGYAVYDPRTRYKYHIEDPVNLKEAEVEMQYQLNNNVPWVTINEFYTESAGRYVSVPHADSYGWNQGERVEIDWRMGTDDEGVPCFVLDYDPKLLMKASGDLYDYDEAYI